MSLIFYDENESIQKKETLDNYQNLFLQYSQRRPTLSEALDQMFTTSGATSQYSKALIDYILFKVQNIVDKKKNEIKSIYPNINEEDIKIISSYTCESMDKAYNPYKLVNSNLVKEDRYSGVSNVSKYVFILLSSLRKLNRYSPDNQQKVLFRCIKTNVKLFDPYNPHNSYIKGNKKTFWGFTSTSITQKKAEHFLGSENNKKVGTIFIITGDIWGYDISLFNVFNEKEIILEPEREYIIEDVIPPNNNNGITYVKCRIVNSKCVLFNNKNNLNENYTNIVLEKRLKNNCDNKVDNIQIPNNNRINYEHINNNHIINNNNQIMNNNNQIMNNNNQIMNNNYQFMKNNNQFMINKMNLSNNQNNLNNNLINYNNMQSFNQLFFSDSNLIHIIWADPDRNVESASMFFNKEGYKIHYFHDTPSIIKFFEEGHYLNMNIKCLITSVFGKYNRKYGHPNAFQMIDHIKRKLTNNSNIFFVMLTLYPDVQKCKDFGFDLIVNNDRGIMQQLVIKRIKNNISLYREPNLLPCKKEIRQLAEEILSKINIIKKNLDKYVDRCFCQNCETNQISTRGEPKVKYSLPIGWYRFGIKIKDEYINNNIDTSNWHIGYYGTNLNTAISIIDNQRIMFPGEYLNNGEQLPPQNKFNPNYIYMSPSIKYAKLFSNSISYNGKLVSFAFQCRIKPGTYIVNRQPDNFNNINIDENFFEDEIEWAVDQNSFIVPFGFLIRF